METELKLLLSDASEAHAILAACGGAVRAIRQANAYYDDSRRRWRTAGWSVRLREQTSGGVAEHVLTVKGPAPQVPGSSFVRRGEWERVLGPRLADRARRGGPELAVLVDQVLAAGQGGPLPDLLEPRELTLLGVLRNLRQVAPLPGEGLALVVEVDTTQYPDGTVGWEVELELPSEAHSAEQDAAVARLRQVFQRAGVRWRPTTVTKLARFHAALRGPA